MDQGSRTKIEPGLKPIIIGTLLVFVGIMFLGSFFRDRWNAGRQADEPPEASDPVIAISFPSWSVSSYTWTCFDAPHPKAPQSGLVRKGTMIKVKTRKGHWSAAEVDGRAPNSLCWSPTGEVEAHAAIPESEFQRDYLVSAPAACATSERDYELVAEAISNSDESGLKSMVLRGRAHLLDRATRVRVRRISGEVRMVEVLSGEAIGEDCWIPKATLR